MAIAGKSAEAAEISTTSDLEKMSHCFTKGDKTIGKP